MPGQPAPGSPQTCPLPCTALQLMCGLMLLSPCCQKPSWWEWTWGNVACRQLYYQGWHASVKKYFVQRLYGELMQQALDGESDLLQVGRRCLPPPLLDHPSPPPLRS